MIKNKHFGKSINNSQILWEKFDPESYVRNNYSYIHPEDRNIIKILIKYYENIAQIIASVEIGCGPNIYPLMLALPKVKYIDVIEYSTRNKSYLENNFKN